MKYFSRFEESFIDILDMIIVVTYLVTPMMRMVSYGLAFLHFKLEISRRYLDS